jgi:hypothetical protein
LMRLDVELGGGDSGKLPPIENLEYDVLLEDGTTGDLHEPAGVRWDSADRQVVIEIGAAP